MGWKELYHEACDLPNAYYAFTGGTKTDSLYECGTKGCGRLWRLDQPSGEWVLQRTIKVSDRPVVYKNEDLDERVPIYLFSKWSGELEAKYNRERLKQEMEKTAEERQKELARREEINRIITQKMEEANRSWLSRLISGPGRPWNTKFGNSKRK